MIIYHRQIQDIESRQIISKGIKLLKSIEVLDEEAFGDDSYSEGYSKFDFKPRNNKEIPLRKGDRIRVIKAINEKWSQVIRWDDEPHRNKI